MKCDYESMTVLFKYYYTDLHNQVHEIYQKGIRNSELVNSVTLPIRSLQHIVFIASGFAFLHLQISCILLALSFSDLFFCQGVDCVMVASGLNWTK